MFCRFGDFCLMVGLMVTVMTVKWLVLFDRPSVISIRMSDGCWALNFGPYGFQCGQLASAARNCQHQPENGIAVIALCQSDHLSVFFSASS
jgi:hypothetical protein